MSKQRKQNRHRSLQSPRMLVDETIQRASQQTGTLRGATLNARQIPNAPQTPRTVTDFSFYADTNS